MKRELNHEMVKKKLEKSSQILARIACGIMPVRRLIRNRRAESAVISNVILIGAVIVVGFAALFWSQSQSSTYQQQYSDTINSYATQQQERISLEYVSYTNGILRVYLMNSGPISITLQSLRVNNISYNITNLYDFNTGTPLGTTSLNATIGQKEGYISQPVTLAPGSYTLTITTRRESSFVFTITI